MKITILTYVLDDNTSFLSAIKFYLEENGIPDVRIVNSLDKLIGIISDDDAHIFILDHLIGNGKTGLDAVRILKKICTLNKFIIVSGTEDINAVISYVNEGIDGYVSKGKPDSELDIVNHIKKCWEDLDKTIKRIARLQEGRDDIGKGYN